MRCPSCIAAQVGERNPKSNGATTVPVSVAVYSLGPPAFAIVAPSGVRRTVRLTPSIARSNAPFHAGL